MKTKLIIIISVLFIITRPLLLLSQPIVTTAGSPSECPGDIVVPVSVTDCNGVGAISLVFQYDTAVLTYLNYENVHPDLSTGLLIVNQTGNKVIISWASTTAAYIGDDTLMDIRFSGNTGTGSLTWDTQTPGNCEYSDANGNVLPSSYINGSATVYQKPEILDQPDSVTAFVGDNVSFTINAIATGMSREWFFSNDGGANWISTGVTSSTLSVNNVSLAMNGNLYRCVISGECSPDAVSDVAELTVIQPLTTSFDVQNVCPGTITIPVLTSNFTDVASFSLAFSYNTSVLTYSGYQNVNPLLGGNFVCNEAGGTVYLSWSNTAPVTFGTDTTLVEIQFAGTTGSSNLMWDINTPGVCVYTYLNAENIPSVFQDNSFTIYQVPQINTQPVDKIVPENTGTSFSVSAVASGIHYQWQVSTNDGISWSDLSNGGHYGGVTSATLNISDALLSMSGYLYRCIVSGYCTPDVVSNPAEMLVLPRITAIAEDVSDCPGTITVSIDVTHFIGVAAFSLTLSYDESILTFDNYQSLNSALSGGNFTINATGGKVYMTWVSTASATIGDDLLLELNFTGITGTSYLNWNSSDEGACEFSDIDGNIIFDNYINGTAMVYQPPEITGDPSNQAAPEGTSATFTVSATGTGLIYQWQESTDNGSSWINLSISGPYSGVLTSTLTINPVDQSMDGNQYRCVVSGTCPPAVYSGAAVLNVLPPAIITSAGDILNSCTGNIIVPVYVTNFNNVGAISLTLNYDNTMLTYEGYQSLNTALGGGMLIVNATETQVILSWMSVYPANIGSGILIEYKFKANAGISTILLWDTQTPGNCEYSDPDGNLFPTFFNNGNISTVTNALIVDAGSDESIAPGGSVQLNGSVTGGTTPYTVEWTPATWLTDPNILDPVANPPVSTTYTLTVTDDAGCSGSDEMTVEVATAGIDLDLKAFLEGPFGGTEMGTDLNGNNILPLNHPYSGAPWNYPGSENVATIPNANIVDWILIELRETSGGPSTATSATRVARQAGFLLKDGSIVATDGVSMMHFDISVAQNLYVVIWHRNHLAVMSSGALSNSGTTYSWDFTTGAGQAYGTNALKNLGSGVYGMYAGDANSDGDINTTDKTLWGNNAGTKGYKSTDLNFDVQVDNNDKNDIWVGNQDKHTQVPN